MKNTMAILAFFMGGIFIFLLSGRLILNHLKPQESSFFYTNTALVLTGILTAVLTILFFAIKQKKIN